MKKLLSLTLALALALSSFAVFAEGEDVKIYVDGVLLEPVDAQGNPVTPVIIDGTTYLPVRAVAGAVGCTVRWDEKNRSVYLNSASSAAVVTDAEIFGNLEYYTENPYEILGRSAFLNHLKELLGGDYDRLLMPALITCYAYGDEDLITIRASAPEKDFVNEAVIDVHSGGRIDVAVLSPEDKAFGGKNAVKYYSNECPDFIDSESIISFISSRITGNSLGYGIIDFVGGGNTPDSLEGTYTDTLEGGSFAVSKSGADYRFSGKISREGKSCSSSGTLVLDYGCTVCKENGSPSIMFAFSGDCLTVIGLNDTTKVLTSVCKR